MFSISRRITKNGIIRRTPTAESENDQIYRLFASERIIAPQAVAQLPTPEQTEERNRRIIPSLSPRRKPI